MKANPGGQIDLNEVVGRSQLIKQLWDTLEHQSIRMVAERRIGKTTIIKKLCAEPRDGWVTIFQDLEKYHTALEFAVGVYKEVDQLLSITNRTAHRARGLLKSFGGTEVGGFIKLPSTTKELPWKEILSNAIQDLVEEREKKNDRPVFLWDEVPFMLANIKEREGENVAMEVLDILRGLRQTYADKGLRMVITGSIGLHHVIGSLKQKGYANSPVNDTLALQVPVLSPDAANELANKLIEGEKIACKSPQKTAEAVARLSDRFPFYIHHIVKALILSGAEASPDSVGKVVLQQLLDANDPWELNHYRERIPIYYGKAFEQSILALLDSIAIRGKAISLNELLAELQGIGALDDREQLIKLLRLLEQDHYLSRNQDAHYHFQFPLLQRWWKLSRGL